MPIELAHVPPEVEQAAIDYLNRSSPSDGPLYVAEQAAVYPNAVGQTLAVPHGVYVLSLEDAVKKSVGERLHSVRYLLCEGAVPVGAVEISDLGDGFRPHYKEASSGALDSISQVIELLESRQEVRAGSYELRAIRVPALYVNAVWLHGEQDFAALLNPVFPPFEANKVYDLDSFLTTVSDLAKNRLSSLEDDQKGA